MNQPQGPWGQPPQGGYGQQPQGQPYGQQQPYGGQQQQQGGYAPQGGGFGGPPGGGSGYDFGQLYGGADMSVGLRMEEDSYPALVEESEWGRTKDGTKGQWTIVFRTTAPGLKKSLGSPGSKLTMTLSVNPTKQDGSPNPQGLGIMYRQLGALGIPIPPAQPFWELGWSPEQVAQAMKGRPCTLVVKDDEYEGVTRSKIRDIRPPTPGAPTTLPQGGQQGQPFGGPPQGQQQWQPSGQQAPQPWQPPQQPQGQFQGQGYGQQQTGQPPTGQQPQGGPAPQYGQPTYNPNVPPYAQQPAPGQPGVQQFTQQGQAIQPGVHPGHDQMAQQQYPQQPQGQQGPPPNGYPQQPDQGQQQGQPPQGGGAPAPPPWAQQ